MNKIKRFLKLKFFTGFLLLVLVIFLMSVFILVFPRNVNAESWIKVDKPDDELVWIDTSHWETKEVYISDGYYKNVTKKRWVDTSYMVHQGHWDTGQYRVWVKSKKVVPYTAYRYVDTSHWKITYSYSTVITPVHFTVIYGTDSYGWSVYSFASRAAGMEQVYYHGSKYLAQKWVIDYRPRWGGRVYAIKYVFLYKISKRRQTNRQWIRSGYWQSYTAYRVVDTSHWETRTGKYWVDTSYKVKRGYWEEYTEREWVETGHYEQKSVWVEDGYYTEPLHGKIRIEKSPRYIFTKWHKNPDGSQCGMELRVSWEIYNKTGSDIKKNQENKTKAKVKRVKIYEDVKKYNNKGIDKVVIYDDDINPTWKGSLETFTVFEHAGSKESTVHIYLYGDGSQFLHAYFSNPINGFRSINIDYGGTESGAQDWLGGNFTGEVEF